MSNKLLCLILLVLLALAGSASANSFTDAGPDHLYKTAANWSDGVPVYGDPNEWGDMNVDGTICIIDNTHVGADAANPKGLYVGCYGATNEWYITGGQLTCQYLNVTRGKSDSGSDGYLQMTGGDVTVTGTDNSGWLAIPEQFDKSSTGPSGQMVSGHMDLWGGTITADNLKMGNRLPDVHNGGVGTMDIRKGTLILGENKKVQLETFIDDGWITAYEGRGEFQLDYGVRNSSRTTLTATIPCPQPLDGATGVELLPELRWDEDPDPGDPNTYDVWLGEAGSMVEVASDQNEPYYVPTSPLNVNTTYEWQIVRYPGTVSGPVWSFTTTVGVATNPSPGDGVPDIDTDVVLSWDAAAAAEAHDVYLSESLTTVNSRGPDAYLGQVTGTSFDLEGDLEWNSQYHWAIDEVIGGVPQTGIGLVWDFTTKSCSLTSADGDTDADCRITLIDYANVAGNWTRCGWSAPQVCP